VPESPYGERRQVMERRRNILISVIAFVIILAAWHSDSVAESPWPPPKPKLITIATFDIGAGVYQDLSNIGDGIFKKFGVKIRNVPIGNAIARATVTRAGSLQCWGSCSSYYACSEGIFEFGALEWGPQPIRALYICNRRDNFSPATSKESGIKTMADVRGKRIAWVVGNPTINMQVEAYLAFAGLSKNDVELVKFPGFTATMRGLIAGKVDVALVSSAAPGAYEIESSPGGLYWLPIPHSDVAGWKRLQDKAPFVSPVTLTMGAGASPKNPVEVGTYPCPVVVAWETQDEGVCYWLTKMIAESWEVYKDALKLRGPSWHIRESLSARNSIPFHSGSVKYFKEQGLWTEKNEKSQEYQLKRQSVLIKSFEAAKDEFVDRKMKSKEFANFWEKKRVEALKSEDLPTF
jgi:TRAP transporter TAXI family solute receptor